MNARNFLYIRKYNKPSAKRVADDKIRSKAMLLEHNLATPALRATFDTRRSVRDFDWNKLPREFVLKPARGYGGEGILVFKEWKNLQGTTVSGRVMDIYELESHIFDILEGAHSLQYIPDTAYIEERVKDHPFFKRFIPFGLPDLRIIIFNKVPIMAMLRLPTKASEGTANLHRGALGVGVSIRTGITFHAISKNKTVTYIPDTKIKVRGIKIPDWDKVLLLASNAAAASRLGYAGVDMVLDPTRGPMVLEINARPGLSIQLANLASLRTRLERVEGMPILTSERGVELGKSLFTDPHSERVDSPPKVLSVIEKVVLEMNGREIEVEAKIDTGAYRTSLDSTLLDELGLSPDGRNIMIKSASGSQLRPAVDVTFSLHGKWISTTATIANRTHLRYRIIVGRKDLKGFLVNPLISRKKEEEIQTEDIQP